MAYPEQQKVSVISLQAEQASVLTWQCHELV